MMGEASPPAGVYGADVAALKPIIRGEPYAILATAQIAGGSYVDFATTPAYLFLVGERQSFRKRLKWVPGDPDNDGAAEVIGGTSHVAFRLAAEWTRTEGNLPNGQNVTVYLHVGPLTGTSGYGTEIGTALVKQLADGLPVE